MDVIFGIVVSLIIAFAAVNLALLRRETVFEHEQGLLFRKGILKRTLPPGQYRYWSRLHSIAKIDIRLRTISVPGQEVLSSDNITVRVTLAAQYRVSDAVIALTKVESFTEAFYVILQVALREQIGASPIDEIVARRTDVGKEIFTKVEGQAREIGLALKSVDVKDIMFPGDLKRIFAQVLKAQKEGLAALEKARGETAALRNLANAAKMVKDNPALLQLRVLQTLEGGSGNTVVVGFPPEATPILRKGAESDSGEG